MQCKVGNTQLSLKNGTKIVGKTQSLAIKERMKINSKQRLENDLQ